MNTKQQEFDAVVSHLFKQGKPAKKYDRSCVYRTENGLSCAVGCRIPNYMPEFDKGHAEADSTGVNDLVKYFGNLIPKEIKEYEPMFAALQQTHDRCLTDVFGDFDLTELDTNLAQVAFDNALNYTARLK